MHWKWPQYDPGTQVCLPFVCSCYGRHALLHKPRLYDITKDPSEATELDLSQSEHAKIVDILTTAKLEQERSTSDIPTEMHMTRMIARPWLNTCCNFPYCDCKDPDNALNYTLPFKSQ